MRQMKKPCVNSNGSKEPINACNCVRKDHPEEICLASSPLFLISSGKKFTENNDEKSGQVHRPEKQQSSKLLSQRM